MIMRQEREEPVDPARPSLIVTYGSTRRKCIPLDRAVFVLGRAAGADLGLVSPDIAAVHCVIARLANGWCVRDCSGRKATRLNGKSIDESPLVDGDILQVGSFSFQANLPGCKGGPGQSSPNINIDKIQRQRHNLARHALRLRAKLLEMEEDFADLEAREEDLLRNEDRIRSIVRDLEGRAARLEADRRLAQDALTAGEKDRAEVVELRAELERTTRETELYLARERAVLQQERAELDRLRLEPRTKPSAQGTDPRLTQDDERERTLARRAAELRYFAAHLQRLRHRLHEAEACARSTPPPPPEAGEPAPPPLPAGSEEPINLAHSFTSVRRRAIRHEPLARRTTIPRWRHLRELIGEERDTTGA